MRRLFAVCAALLSCACVGLIWFSSFPSQQKVDETFQNAPFDIRLESTECKDVSVLSDLIAERNILGDNVRLLMGSSELGLLEPCASHPALFFSEHNYGLNTISIGEAGYQSLWHAVELGALDAHDSVPDKKAAFIVGMQWFFGDGCTKEAFLNSFSQEAYQTCMDNPRISSKTKQEISKRTIDLGADVTLGSPSPILASIDKVDAVIEESLKSGETRRALLDAAEDNTSIPSTRFEGSVEKPDWEKWFAFEEKEGAQSCTNNNYGVYNEYYTQYFVPWLKDAQELTVEPDLAYSEKELSDFKLYLQICKECDIEPLIIIMPVKAAYYDFTPHNRESRQVYYNMIRSTCNEYGVEYADFSSYEEDTYFMRDVMHFGWTGWLHVDKAMLEFFLGDSE